MNYTRIIFIGSVLSCLGACSSGDQVDIGEGRPDDVGAALADYEGSWNGYAEAFSFADGTDDVSLVLDDEGNGTVTFGEAAPPPPATDPDVVYPPGPALEVPYRKPGDIVPGVAYTVRDAQVEAKRIRFGLSTADPYIDWCALQTSYPIGSDLYWCVPNLGSGQDENGCFLAGETGRLPVDCGKLALCRVSGPCECDASGCAASDTVTITFDAAFTDGGAAIEGTLRIGSERITTRLTP